MTRAKTLLFFIATFALIPIALGFILFRESSQVSGTSYSTSPKGHRALYELLSHLEFEPSRLHVEANSTMSPAATLLALEPGETFFRDFDLESQSLIEWIQKGNSALITFESDSDQLAQRDDREVRQIDWIKEAQESVARVDNIVTTTSTKASNSVTSQSVVRQEPSDLDKLNRWLGVSITKTRDNSIGFEQAFLTKSDEKALDGLRLQVTRPRLMNVEKRHRLIGTDNGTLVAEFSLGQGSVLVLSEPRLLQNMNIARADNATLVIRMIEYLAKTPDSARIIFEEFSHSVSQRYTWFGFIFSHPNIYFFLSVLITLLLFIWCQMARVVSPSNLQSERSGGDTSMIYGLAGLYQLVPTDRELASTFRTYSLQKLQNIPQFRGDTELFSAIANHTSLSVDEIEDVFRSSGDSREDSYAKTRRIQEIMRLCLKQK